MNDENELVYLDELPEMEDSLIKVFDFLEDWRLVLPHLHKPEVENALAKGMNAYNQMRYRLCIERGLTVSKWEPWDPQYGPLDNDSSDYWLTRCDKLLEEAIDRGEIEFEWPEDEEEMQAAVDKHSELADQFYPNPDTLEWYQLWHASHYLALWQRELGKCVYPDLDWKLMTGDEYSIAYGADKLGNIKMIFDILGFEHAADPAGIIHLAALRRVGPPKDWGEQLTARPAPGLFD